MSRGHNGTTNNLHSFSYGSGGWPPKMKVLAGPWRQDPSCSLQPVGSPGLPRLAAMSWGLCLCLHGALLDTSPSSVSSKDIGHCIWGHLDSPGWSPHLSILTLVRCAESLLPHKVLLSGPGFRTERHFLGATIQLHFPSSAPTLKLPS